MHRTSWAWSLLAGLAALLVGWLTPEAAAQTCTPETPQLVVPINSTVRLQMLNKKRIRAVTNPKEGVVTLRTVEGDPSSIILLGTGAGITRIEMEDVDGGREVRLVIVQADVEYLIGQIRRAVPLAQINVIPNGANSVILSGYVQRAEDIVGIQAIAQSANFTVINFLRLNGVQQVQLDVVIAQVRRTKGRNFGFNFLQNSRRQIAGSTIGNLLPTVSQTAVGVTSAVLQPASFGQAIAAPPGQGNLFGGVISTNAGFLGFLQALENEGLAKILSQPRLVALSGNTASFLVGGEQAVPVPAGLGQVGVQFEEFGTRLNFLPLVMGNGRIHLQVEPEVSTLDPNAGVAIAGATVAGRATQRINTTVELESGQTYVIGGLIQKVTTASANKVPWLGQLPFIGAAFSTKTHTDDETELVVMVTPHLVDAQTSDQVVKVLPGQETRSPDDFELFLEGILEAPRGPRAVFQHGCYVPAHRNGPTADLFPCAGSGDGCLERSHHRTNCPPTGCTPSAPVRPAPAANHSPVGMQNRPALLAPPVRNVEVSVPITEEPPQAIPVAQPAEVPTEARTIQPAGSALMASSDDEVEKLTPAPRTGISVPMQQPIPPGNTTGGNN